MNYQLPPIDNENDFEDFTTDLFNELHNTITFKRFGKKGHNQKGIDIFSASENIVIQCKKKDLSRKVGDIKRELLHDIDATISKVETLKIPFETLYILSTFKDDPDLDEYCEEIRAERNISFCITYWGWDTITRYLNDKPKLLLKYYPIFHSEKETTPEDKLKAKLAMRRRIIKDFSPWLDYLPENWERKAKMIIRKFDNKTWPNENPMNEFGEYDFFAAGIIMEYEDGLLFQYRVSEKESPSGLMLGYLCYNDIVDYEMTDPIDRLPMFYCKFNYRGLPFKKIEPNHRHFV